MRVDELAKRVADGERLNGPEYLLFVQEAPLGLIEELADSMRRRLHPDNVVTYVIDRNINYSNICTAVCTFCAFYRKPGSPEGYVLTFEEIFQKVEETLQLGGSGILMQGGLHPDLPLEWYTALLRELKQRYGIHLHCFSPPEIYAFTQLYRMSTEEVLSRLIAAGLDSIPGGGGEILVDRVRKRISPLKAMSDDWLSVMDVAHRLGLKSSATMMLARGNHRRAHRTPRTRAPTTGQNRRVHRIHRVDVPGGEHEVKSADRWRP